VAVTDAARHSKDANYGEALRLKDEIRPVERIPEPGLDFDSTAFAAEHKVTLESALAEPLGSYMFARFMTEVSATAEEAAVLECLVGIRAFRRSEGPTPDTLLNETLKHLPEHFKSSSAYQALKEQRNNDVTAYSVADTPELAELETQLRESLRGHWEPFQASAVFQRYMRLKWYAQQPVALKNFTIFRDLGRGAYGVVAGARLNTTGAMVAIKHLNKKLVKGKNALKLVSTEKSILEKLGNKPSLFTIWLQYSWSDKDVFYLALPLATGGDLAYHMLLNGFFPEERARFTAAEIVLGIGHLHSLGIIYRDLKPENILLEDSGHARISDMGLAVHCNFKRIKGQSGTPGYWAPEMIKKEEYGDEVDWWSLGCVMYEFLAGRCPFSKQNAGMERNDATLTWELQFPTHCGGAIPGIMPTSSSAKLVPGAPFPKDAEAIIRKLLNRTPSERLGYGRKGLDAIKADPYFNSVDWLKLSVHALDPPFVPQKQAIYALGQKEIDERNDEYEHRKEKLTEEDEISNFYYVSTHAHQQDIVRVLELEKAGKLDYLNRTAAKKRCTIC